MRRRLGWWALVAVLSAGCTASGTNKPPPTDRTDVWFMQHMVGHLRQTTSIAQLTGERITHRGLAELANTINQDGQAHIATLQGWLDRRGLAGFDPQQQASTRKKADLERLSHVRGAKLDLAFIKVMTARHRAGIQLAATEARTGTLPEVRELARQLLAEQQAQVDRMEAWRRAWSRSDASRSTSTTRSAVGGLGARLLSPVRTGAGLPVR